jgi:hypothetical protein
MKVIVFWDVVRCSLLDTDRPDYGSSKTSETSVNFYETARHNIPKDILILVTVQIEVSFGVSWWVNYEVLFGVSWWVNYEVSFGVSWWVNYEVSFGVSWWVNYEVSFGVSW